MESKNLLTLAITLTVGIILAGSLLMPVLNDATTTEHKIINTGAYNMTDVDDDYSIIYDPSGKLTIGDKEIAFSDLPTTAITLASAKDMLLRMQNIADQSYGVWLFKGDDTPRNVASNSSTETVTITINNGHITWGNSDITYTSDESVRLIDPDGAYVMTDANKPATVLQDTTVIIGNGTTQVNSWTNRFYIEGTAEDITVTPSSGITVSNITVNTTEISQYKEAVKLNSVTFTATDGTNTVDATYNRVIVPVEIDAELAQHLDNGQIAIMNAIPIMIIVALVAMAAGALYFKRDD